MMKTIKPSATSKKSIDPSILEIFPCEPLNWHEIIREWDTSSLSQEKFCKDRSLNYNTFVYQRAKLTKQKPKTKSSPLFPVKLIQPRQETTAPSPKDNTFVIQWPNGVKLSIPSNADAVTLKIILTSLEKS